MRWIARLAFTVSIVGLMSTTAMAQEDEYTKIDWPLSVVKRPLTLAGGMFEARGDTFKFELSEDLAGDAIGIAPDLFYGINSQLTVGIVHNFPANVSARGFCISGDGCTETYNNVGAEAHYGLMRGGNFQFAVVGGLQFPFFSPEFTAGLNFRAVAKLNVGNVAVRVEPEIYVGALERDLFKETVFLPAHIQFQINNQTNVYLVTGVEGPLESFGDLFAVPVGVGLTFAINNRLDIGGEFRFTNLLGKDRAPTTVGTNAGIDGRMAIARAALRL